jgi:hypothetical protein
MTRTQKFANWFEITRIGGDDCGMPANKTRFKLDGKHALKELAKAIGLSDYDLRFNAGGPAVSGEVTLHGERIYVQIADSCMGKRVAVLFRKCKGRKDYCGETNHFAPVQDLANGKLAQRISALLQN